MSTYFAPHAWLPDGLAAGVRLGVEGSRFATVDTDCEPAANDIRLDGVVLPGFANTHSHAFHRALRGRTHDDGGTFWTWRERMYEISARLDPESYLRLARATYAEMALAGVTCVGEFHYLHHRPNGTRYDDPNEMGRALIEAARQAGIRITLLDTCYLTGGFDDDGHVPLGPEQLRFSDGNAEAWASRFAELADGDGSRIGAAIHSVRAVPRTQIPVVRDATVGRPLHIHLSEQPAENEQCLRVYGITPTRLLADVEVLSPRTTAVHATHLTDADIDLLGASRTNVSFCPTTERDLADGIGPARLLVDAGSVLTLGSDQHAVIDLLEEARALEMDERLNSLQRGRFSPDELVGALTGHASLGWDDAGTIAVNQRADLVSIRLDSPRTAGSLPAQVVLSASAPDVATVMVDGRIIVENGRHVLGDVGGLLDEAISPLWLP